MYRGAHVRAALRGLSLGKDGPCISHTHFWGCTAGKKGGNLCERCKADFPVFLRCCWRHACLRLRSFGQNRSGKQRRKQACRQQQRKKTGKSALHLSHKLPPFFPAVHPQKCVCEIHGPSSQGRATECGAHMRTAIHKDCKRLLPLHFQHHCRLPAKQKSINLKLFAIKIYYST